MLDRRRFLAVCFAIRICLNPAARHSLYHRCPGPDCPRRRQQRRLAARPREDHRRDGRTGRRACRVHIAPDQIPMMLDGLNQQRDGYAPFARSTCRTRSSRLHLRSPAAGTNVNTESEEPRYSIRPLAGFRSTSKNWPSQLSLSSVLLRTRKVSSAHLTEMYIDRLRQYDPQLHFVVTSPKNAPSLRRKPRSDIAAGKYRGPCTACPGARRLARRERLSHHLGCGWI